VLKPSEISNPLRSMEIRFDGIQNTGGLRTVNGARFGPTRNGGTRPHGGVDLYAVPGTPVFAIADGVVERVRLNDPSYGKDVLLRFKPSVRWMQALAARGVVDKDGELFALYAHLSSVALRSGQEVRRGQIIGQTGISGNADQRYPHLHLEIRKVASPGIGAAGLRNRVDPELFFLGIDFSKSVEALQRYGRIA